MPIITMRVRMDGGHGGDDHDDSPCTGAMKTSVYLLFLWVDPSLGG